MDIVEKYRRQAEECEAIARRASTESQRQRIMEIAKVWRELAADRERVIESAEDVRKPERSGLPRMDILAEYRRRAAECERLAEEAITEHHRQAILQIAASWRELAEQRERLSLTPKAGEPTA